MQISGDQQLTDHDTNDKFAICLLSKVACCPQLLKSMPLDASFQQRLFHWFLLLWLQSLSVDDDDDEDSLSSSFSSSPSTFFFHSSILAIYPRIV